MTNPDNVELKAAYEFLLEKHSQFPFTKEEYEPFVNDILKGTAE